RMVLAGTHTRIQSVEMVHSAAFGKGMNIRVFTDFTYLQPAEIQQLVQRWVNADFECEKGKKLLLLLGYYLQGRPRILTSFIRRLAKYEALNGVSDAIDDVFAALNAYRSWMTTSVRLGEPEKTSLYDFWKDRIDLTVTKFDSRAKISDRHHVSALLIDLCINFLFGNRQDITYNPHLDVVSTGL